MNDDALLEVSSQAHGFAPLGEVLAAARKAKKLSEKDVSNNLRLSLKQISDIENNNFSTLPQPMITRGFIRNYARLLEIDAEPLLESYRARMPDKTPKSLAVQSSMNEVFSGKESQPWLKYILGSILILLFLLAWIFYIDYMPKPAKTPSEKASSPLAAAPSTTELTLPEVALPAAERQADPADVVAGTESGNTANTAITLPAEAETATTNTPVANPAIANNAVTPNPASVNSNATNPNATSIAQTAKPADSVKPLTPVPSSTANPVTTPANPLAPKANTAVDFNTLKEKAGQNALAANKANVTPTTVENSAPSATQKVSLTITEKTWIQATDKSGKVVYERILPAGSTDGFDGQPPFNVVIGNAKATKLSFLGKPVDLAPSTTQNNVARIKLE